jgi:hypothetical protein
MRLAIARVGGLDQIFEHVECGRLDTIAEQELLCAWKLLNRRDQPHQTPCMFNDVRG